MKPLTIITCAAATIAALAGPALGDTHGQRHVQRTSPTTDAQLNRLDDLIADVEHGRSVRSNEIDRARGVR